MIFSVSGECICEGACDGVEYVVRFILVWFFKTGFLLCSLGCPETPPLDLAGLKLKQI